jgi:hypothetical protein
MAAVRARPGKVGTGFPSDHVTNEAGLDHDSIQSDRIMVQSFSLLLNQSEAHV